MKIKIQERCNFAIALNYPTLLYNNNCKVLGLYDYASCDNKLESDIEYILTCNPETKSIYITWDNPDSKNIKNCYPLFYYGEKICSSYSITLKEPKVF